MSSPSQPSKFARIQTWLALGLLLLMLALGIAWYGFSIEVHHRFWHNIAGRLEGPMTFRFILQPTMAFIAALADGIRDVRAGHKSFFWTKVDDPEHQHGRLREGAFATSRLALLGLSMDIIYQFKVLDHFYPAEAFVMVIPLAIIPYFIFRWCIEGAARWWLARKSTGPAS